MRGVAAINISPRRGRPRRILKIDPQRPLHYARRAGRARRPKSSVGLNDLAEIRAKYQSAVCIPCGSRIDREGHSAVDVREICAVEKVVRLPAELNTPLLTEAEILEERQICIEDRGKASQISLQIAD